MDERLLDLLRRQHAAGFPDVAGARASITLPITDRLVTALINERVPPTAPVRDIEVRAHAGNKVSVRLRVTRPIFMPPLSVNLVIERQPQLPSSPVLVLRVATGGGLMALAGSAIRFMNVLPPGIAVDGDLLHVNLQVLLEQRGLAQALHYLEHLEVVAEDGRFVISGGASLRRP